MGGFWTCCKHTKQGFVTVELADNQLNHTEPVWSVYHSLPLSLIMHNSDINVVDCFCWFKSSEPSIFGGKKPSSFRRNSTSVIFSVFGGHAHEQSDALEYGLRCLARCGKTPCRTWQHPGPGHNSQQNDDIICGLGLYMSLSHVSLFFGGWYLYFIYIYICLGLYITMTMTIYFLGLVNLGELSSIPMRSWQTLVEPHWRCLPCFGYSFCFNIRFASNMWNNWNNWLYVAASENVNNFTQLSLYCIQLGLYFKHYTIVCSKFHFFLNCTWKLFKEQLILAS